MRKTVTVLISLMVLTLLGAGCIESVKEISYRPSSLFTIRDSLTTIMFTLYRGNKPGLPKKTRTYYWYGTNQIHSNEGGYSGRLLNGHYMVYDEEGSLRVKGEFDKGLKDSQWVFWTPEGRIKYRVKYRNGTARDTSWMNPPPFHHAKKNDTTLVQPPKK